jgi:hypothetical protein
MNKSSTLVIAIPLFIIMLILAGVFTYRTMSQKTSYVSQQTNTVIPTLKGPVGKPQSGFSDTKTTSAVGDLSSDLNGTQDDGGAADFSALASEAAKL